MYKDGEAEPALVGPWTMGRDKKNPKPLDVNAFNTLVKTAYEVLRRHEQQLHAQLHKSTVVSSEGGELKVTLDIVPDEDIRTRCWPPSTRWASRWRRCGSMPASSCRRRPRWPGWRTISARPRAAPQISDTLFPAGG
jgi:hypothetical protein